ncbi:hypothetical protein AXK11_01910 [Cephaloticoccus primus]|uniref:HTH cro/C1-type domain-containing protein n=2 Tax=Cephaloticoccus primus TaxID=1548207 RepID=A0A139SSP0_9BACT|nr:hypothetical protein AXK11_01910 [Cephaloticoccus primus]
MLRSEFRFQNEFAAHIDKAPAQITQWLSGVRLIGHKAAREIETACGKPAGWLDNDHSIAATNAVANALGIRSALSPLPLSAEEAELTRHYRHCTAEARPLLLAATRAIAQASRKSLPPAPTAVAKSGVKEA